jgi:hypothetical protein
MHDAGAFAAKTEQGTGEREKGRRGERVRG